MKRRYHIYEELGRGGMGVVYRATDRLEGGKWIALKQLHSDLKRIDIDTSRVDNRRLVMSQEFRILASLRHPNIISVLDYGFSGEAGEPYFTMDLLEKPQTILKATEDHSLAQKIDCFMQCLDGLAYLHQRKIVHRDLKPENVMIDDAKVKILDFGLAEGGMQQSQAWLDSSYLAGTLSYMAPELFMEQAATNVSDLYALGIIMYEVLVREHPLGSLSTMAILINAALNKLPNLEPLDENLVSIFARLLAKDPNDRYQSAQDVMKAFSDAFDFVELSESIQVREDILQSAPFVGRDDEFNQLKQALLSILKEQTQIGSSWLLGGESGVGKSRLLNELRVQAMIRGVLVLSGQGIHEGGAVYELWRQPLRHLSLELPPTLEEASILKSIIPDIEALMGQTIPDAPPALNPKIALERLLTAIENWFSRSEQPILLILEDIHWAVESLVILKRLLALSEKTPLMIVCSYRDDERPNLPAELHGMQLMTLPRLSRQAISDLSTSLLGESGQAENIITLLERETDGNALFIIEVFRALAESAGRIDLVGHITIPQSIISGGIQQIIQRRLMPIKAQTRTFLQLAALIGRQLDSAVLAKLMPDEDIDYLLRQCTEALILEVYYNQYRFVHDKFREVLMAELPEDEQRSWHRRIAQVMETVYADDISRAPILLYHWKKADDMEQIVHYSELAGDQSMENGANLQAKDYYYQANDLLSRLVDSTENRRKQIELAVKLSRVAAYHPEESLTQIMHNAVATAETLADDELLARALGSTGAYHFMLGQTGASMQYFQRSMVLAEKMNLEELLLLPYNILGRSVALVGDFAASRNYLRDGIRLAEKFKDLELLSGSLAFYALSLMVQGAFPESVPIIERSVEVAEQVGASRMTGTLVINGCGYMWNGRWDNALDFFTRSESLAEKINDFLPLYWSRGFLGYIHLHNNELEQAKHYLELSLSMIEEGKTVFHLPLFQAYRAELTLHEGNTDLAQEQAEKALQFGRDTQQGLAIGEALCILGKIHSKQGNLEQAQDYFKQSIENHIAGGRLVQEVVTYYELARHHARYDETEHAIEAVETGIEGMVKYKMNWYLEKARKLRASLD